VIAWLLCVHLSAFLASTSTDLAIAKLLNNCHYTAFTDKQGGKNFMSCFETVTLHQVVNPMDVVRHYCIARATTPWFVMKFWSSCFSFSNPSHQLSHSIHIYSCFTIHFEQMLVNTSWLLTFSNQELNHCSLFKMHISAVIGLTVVLPSAK
jgi:hypothetical protein